MKKLVILFFLFLGGVCFLIKLDNVYAVEMESKSSISFSETYVYTPPPEEGNINGVTPTGNPPKKGNLEFPQTGESNNTNLIQIGTILLLASSFIIKIIGRRN